MKNRNKATMKALAMAGIIGLITAIFFPTGSYASISENFESAEVGTPPAGWTFMENWADSGTIKVHICNLTNRKGNDKMIDAEEYML